MDGKHTDALPALPKSYVMPGLGNASVTGDKAWHLADWGKVTRPVKSPEIGAGSASAYRRGIPEQAVQKDEGVVKCSVSFADRQNVRPADGGSDRIFLAANRTAKSTGMPRPLSGAL